MKSRTLIIEETIEELNERAVELITERARNAIRERGKFTMALSGGSTPRRTYELLALRRSIDWDRVYLFWGDERFVERTNPYSNFPLAAPLVEKAPSANVFPVPVDAANPTEGARQYAETICSFFDVSGGEIPRLDLALNGLGPDGHTASLFPHAASIQPSPTVARMAHAGLHPWVDRITLTRELFNNARCVLFLASGSTKAGILREVLTGRPNRRLRPASAIRPTNGELIWLVDRSIAAELPS